MQRWHVESAKMARRISKLDVPSLTDWLSSLFSELYSVPTKVLIILYGKLVLLNILLQLLLSNSLSNLLAGMHALENIKVFTEDSLCTCHVSCAVNSLFKTRHNKTFAILLYRHTAGMIASRNRLERVANEVIVEHPEVAPNAGMSRVATSIRTGMQNSPFW